MMEKPPMPERRVPYCLIPRPRPLGQGIPSDCEKRPFAGSTKSRESESEREPKPGVFPLETSYNHMIYSYIYIYTHIFVYIYIYIYSIYRHLAFHPYQIDLVNRVRVSSPVPASYAHRDPAASAQAPP